MVTKISVFPLFICILTISVVASVFFAANTVYLWDESRDWIPEAQKISFDPVTWNLPIRTDRKGAFFAYVLKLSDVMDEGLHLNHRWANILFSAISTGLIALIAKLLSGRAVVAVVAAGIFALNEFTISISATGIQISVYFTLSLAAIYTYIMYLDRRLPVWLYLTALFVGLAFLAYEIGILTAGAMGLFLFWKLRLDLFKSAHAYIAGLLFLLVISPDIYANTIGQGTQTVSYDELSSRILGLGINPQYVAFYVKDILDTIYPYVLGRPLRIEGAEFTYLNSWTGTGLFLAFALSVAGHFFSRCPSTLRHFDFLLWLFLLVFGTFSVINVSDVQGAGVPLYVSLTLVPAAIIAADFICRGSFLSRTLLGLIGVGLVAGIYGLVADNYGRPRAEARIIPEILLAPDNAMMDVSIKFDVCDLCPRNFEPVLVNAGVLDHANAIIPHTKFSDDIRGVEIGESVTEFSVRAIGLDVPPAWMARIYAFEYDLVSSGEVFATVKAHTRVPHDKAGFVEWPKLFWVD